MKKIWLNVILLPLLLLLTLVGAIVSPAILAISAFRAGLSGGLTARNLVWIYGRICVWLVGRFIPLRTLGLEHARSAGPCILVANHQSFLDLHILGALPTPNVVIVVKGWPFKIPFYGIFMRISKYLDSDALDQQSLLRLGSEALAGGASLFFFPEGTRSRDGRLGRFRSGAFKLAVETGRPLVPVCLSGMGRLLAPGRLLLGDSSIVVEALPPIDPVAYRDTPVGHIALRRKVKSLMVEKLGFFSEQDLLLKDNKQGGNI